MNRFTQTDLNKLSARGMRVTIQPPAKVSNSTGLITPKPGVLKEREDDIQKACFTWFKFAHTGYRLRLFHIPNGGQRKKSIAAKLKGQGTLSGVWDIFLSVPRYGFSGMFIEMKAGKNDLTENQFEFREANDKDYLFRVCRSLEEFKKEVDKYLG